MAVSTRPCLVSSSRMNHFGINPESGGSPPSESRIKGVREVIMGVLAEEVAKALIVVELFNLKTMNAENVMTK